MKKINSVDKIRSFKNKICFLYVNFDIKINNNRILDDRKIREAIDTIEFLSSKKVKIIISSDSNDIKDIEIILERLKHLLKLGKKFNNEIILYEDKDLDNLDHVVKASDFGDVICLRSIDFYSDYKKHNKYFSKNINYFVFDNFENFSSYNFNLFKIKTFYGYSFLDKYNNFLKLKIGKSANTVVVGGEYNKNKIDFIENLLRNKSTVLLGGEVSAMFAYVYINRILNKKSVNVKSSSRLYNLLMKYKKNIILPSDFLVGDKKYKNVKTERKAIMDIKLSDYIFDIGPETIKKYLKYINRSNVLIWSGLLGMVEDKKFSNSSLMMAEIFCNKAKGRAFGVVVGNRTCKFVIDNKFGDDVDYLFFEKKTFYGLLYK